MRLKLIGCQLLVRELSEAIVRSPHVVDAEYLPAGLHCSGAKVMRTRIQGVINAADTGEYDAIVLGYALCGLGLAKISARTTRLVLPRAHDCITLLVGGRKRYNASFASNPGTYYRSVGWTERAKEMTVQLFGTPDEADLEGFIERYGEENGRYLHAEMTAYQQHYSELVYIENGLEKDRQCVMQARAEAEEKGWIFSRLAGDLKLFRRLLSGDWDWEEDFLVVPPGQTIAATYDDRIMETQPVDAPTHSGRKIVAPVTE